MDDIHFKILDFLNRQKEPVHEDRFPNFITSYYTHNTTSEGGLIHDLRIVLAATKQWIDTVKYIPNYYIISDYGKAALQKEIDKRNEESLARLEKNKMDRQGIRISKKALIWTIIGVLSAVLLGLIAGYKQGWFCEF